MDKCAKDGAPCLHAPCCEAQGVGCCAECGRECTTKCFKIRSKE